MDGMVDHVAKAIGGRVFAKPLRPLVRAVIAAMDKPTDAMMVRAFVTSNGQMPREEDAYEVGFMGKLWCSMVKEALK
jgi:hypothetical protein